jgi:predicted nucleic acid-binding protein
MTYLLDSSILSELSSPTPDSNLIDWLTSQPEESIFISVVTISEVAEAMQNEESETERSRLLEWLNNDLIVRFTGRISEISVSVSLKWTELISQFKAIGRTISLADSVNLAIAMVYDHTLVTKDPTSFENTGAKVFYPYKSK